MIWYAPSGGRPGTGREWSCWSAGLTWWMEALWVIIQTADFLFKAGVMAAVWKDVGTVPVVGEECMMAEMRKTRKGKAGFNKLCMKGVLQTVAVMLEWDQTTRRQWTQMSWRWAQRAAGVSSSGKLPRDVLLCLCGSVQHLRPWWVLFTPSFASVGPGLLPTLSFCFFC